MVDGFYSALVKILKQYGYELFRHGKGSHEIWRHTQNGNTVTVPRSTKSRHTVNAILKQAKIPEKL